MTEANNPNERTIRTIPIEWNWDMDATKVSLNLSGGPFTEFALKGRCKRCWGTLRGRRDPGGPTTGILCLVCGKVLEGAAAEAEEERTSNESWTNAINMMWGLQPKYGDGPFLQKVFPMLDRLSEEEILDRVAHSRGQYRKIPKGRLTRHEFPMGSPGWFFLQARLLIDGVSDATDHQRESIADLPDLEVDPDGSVTVEFDFDGMSENPRHKEQDLLTRAGSLLGNGMIAAFACELALKAISLTCTDEATKTHDLLELFEDLPRESQDRLTADFSTIRDVLARNRGSFGAWRYFEADVGRVAFGGMIYPERSRSLAKTARVILDEGEYVGLTAGIQVRANRKDRVTGEARERSYRIQMTITGGECPPRPFGTKP